MGKTTPHALSTLKGVHLASRQMASQDHLLKSCVAENQQRILSHAGKGAHPTLAHHTSGTLPGHAAERAAAGIIA